MNNRQNKPQQMKSQGVVAPPPQAKKPADPPLSGYIAVISIENGGIKVHPKMAEKPASNYFALNFEKQYRIDLDEREVYMNNKKVKSFNLREKPKKGWFSKAKPVQTSVNTLFINEQYHKDLAEIEFVSLHQSLQQAKSQPKNSDADEVYIEVRTSNNKRALMKGAGKFALLRKVKSLGQKAKAYGQKLNENTKKAQQWAKEQIKEQFKEPETGSSRQPEMIPNQMQPQKPLQPHEIQALYNQQQGGMPDLKKDAKNMVKWAMDLPERGYKSIQNKAKELYKEIRGGDMKKAKKCCKDLEKLCKQKCKKNQKGGNNCSFGGGCKCGKKCKCGSKCKCGGNPFNIHSKENQEFGKELEKQYNKKANSLKAQIKEIQEFKKQLKKMDESEFNNNLKSKKHMSNADKKKEMLNRQDKKIAAKKQAIKDHEQKIYGMFR